MVIACLLGISWFAKVPAVTKGSFAGYIGDNAEVVIAKKLNQGQQVIIRLQGDKPVDIKGTVGKIDIRYRNRDSVSLMIHTAEPVVFAPLYAKVNIITNTRLLNEFITGLKKE